MYVLFFGRMVTCMGSIASSMMTLIMSNKLGMTPSQIATLLMSMSFAQLPFVLIGGKLADKFNKKYLIVFCDLITVSCYFAMAMMEMSYTVLVLFFIAGVFAKMEWPVFDSLVADFSTLDQRERAYSLNYLGANLGIVLAPALGGLLFEHHLNIAFMITSLGTLSSTLLIFFLIKNLKPEKTEVYDMPEKGSLIKILFSRKVVFFYIMCAMISRAVYSQFNYLIPINLDLLYGADGAKYFGFLTSLNGVVVIIATPLITNFCPKIKEVFKTALGEGLIVFSLAMYIFIQGMIPMYYLSMVIFTVGEVFAALGNQSYLTKRVPASHRARVASFNLVMVSIFEGVMLTVVGGIADASPIVDVWKFIAVIGTVAVIMYLLLVFFDKRKYPLLYKGKISQMEHTEMIDKEIVDNG